MSRTQALLLIICWVLLCSLILVGAPRIDGPLILSLVISGALVFTAKTTHCFVSPTGRPLVLKKAFPEFDKVLRALVVGTVTDAL